MLTFVYKRLLNLAIRIKPALVSDLEPIFESENPLLYKNPEQVSRFYGADNFSPEALEPLDYDIISPVEYKATGHDKNYTIFVPPNLDLGDWVLDGEKALESFYATWESQDGKVEYSRFKIYEISYIISGLGGCDRDDLLGSPETARIA